MALSSSGRKWIFDVFPSFRGEDVRATFLSHFLKELDRKLIFAFKDSEIQRSRSLDPGLKHTIRDSRIAVVIISKNYASSSWCLNELLEIVKCKEECDQIVIPVFYGLDPSHVWRQRGEFGQIFEKTCRGIEKEVIIRWRRALTHVAEIPGYVSNNWDDDAKMTEEIAKDVFHKLNLYQPKDSEYFVGIEDHMAKMQILLQLESEEVRVVGIWGPLGIGKTTIARSLFGLLSPTFQNSIFIDRDFVSKSIESSSRANMDDYNMKLQLQSKFLSSLSGIDGVKVFHLGAVRERLQHRKVLILIDDLDDLFVLDALVDAQWYGSGSRIIVVTTDRRFLRAHGIDCIYTVGLPSEDLALPMFCQSAFRSNDPPDGFRELASQVVLCAGSLPLALKVFASNLRGMDKEYWMDWIQSFQRGVVGADILKRLRISYDVLDEKEKAIFRHIACLFIGEEVNNIKLFLEDSKLDVDSKLMGLVEKSLIHVREGTIDMHRLLQEMGKKIVHEKSNKPGNREFLVDSNDIRDVFEGNTGAEKVIGIALGVDETDDSYMDGNAFQGMSNLRFLKIFIKEKKEVRWDVPQEFNYFPTKLRLLSWENCPMKCMPPKFHPENLVKLEMQGSKLEKLWEGVHQLKRLKIMDMSGSKHLKEIPDLSMAINLETLCLKHCSSLVELPSSIQYLNKLEELDISFCNKMETLPTGINLPSLNRLDLRGCSRLRSFPDISTNISHFDLSQTRIEQIPSNLRLDNLVESHMEEMMSDKIWVGMQPLTPLMTMLSPSLKGLWLSNIPNLVELPSSLQNLNKLEELCIRNCTNLETIPTGINLKHLSILDLSGCSRLWTFPDISTNLSDLTLSQTAIEEVPWWIQNLSRLCRLDMKECNSLRYVSLNIYKLEHLEKVDFSDCRALTESSWDDSPNAMAMATAIATAMATDSIHSNKLIVPYEASYLRDNSFPMVNINLTNCFKLDHKALIQEQSDFFKCMILSGEEVPSYFTHRTTGTSLTNIPVPDTFPFHPFLKFKACALVYAESISIDYLPFEIQVRCQFIDRLGHHFDYDYWTVNITEAKLGSHPVIFDCCFPLKEGPVAEFNYDHMNIEFHLMGDYSHQLKLKGCGLRLPKDSTNFLAHVSKGDKSPEVILGGHETEEFGDSAVKVSSLHKWSYDVFLSSSREDVHVNHFLTKLDEKLISVFKDNEMDRSQSFDPNRKQAIRDSRIAVIVFSKYYASSSWCLDELVEILECKEKLGQTVIAIFYKLAFSDVRKQLGEFGEAFEKTCKNRTVEDETQWRRALTNAATISGYHVTTGNEAKMTEEIVNDVLSKLKLTPSVEETEMRHNHDAEELTDVEGEIDGVLWNAKSTVNVKGAESVQGEAKFYERSTRDDSFQGEINSVATFNAQISIENKRVKLINEENEHGKVSENSTMVMYDKHIPQHQVFINSWGEEIRFSFISHLVSALSTEGVNVFTERYEKRGEDGNTFRGIEDSNFALVVFSSRYTESRWCLDELVKIKERMDEGKLLVIPIFYKVEPSHVKQMEGSFGFKLWNLWRIHRDHHIIKWKEALESVAAMEGFCLKEDSSESKFITSIVKKVKEVIRISLLEGENQSFLLSTKNGKTTKMSRGKGEEQESFHNKSPLFGIEKRMRQLEMKLEFDCSETRIIGVVGMAGIGKTTLATMLHEKWNRKFVRSVPLSGIHKKSGDYSPAWLRKTLLQVLLGVKFGVINEKTTHESLKDKLLQTKVFVVLDDVSNKKQLKFLLGDLTWIKKGSKIVITSRDKSLIEPFVHETYVVPPLNYEEAFQLFGYHAFGDHVASVKLCRELVYCAGGNPLVIKLLGKQLHGRDEAHWEMRQGDLTHFGLVILDMFRYHCDGLSKKQKDVFLDIASFFRSEDDNFVRSLLDPGDHEATDAENELRDLTRKGMITITGCRVEMHDLLYMFGKIYSSQALIEENGGKSRLLYTPEIIDALINQKDTKSIRGIFLDMFDVTEVMVLHRQAFTNVSNLRYLKIYDSYCPRPCKSVCKLHFPDGLELPLEEVLYLHWVKFPLEELPPDFRPENLVDLRLPYSMIERVWEGVKETPRLKWVDLSHSSKLFNLSALSKAKNLERLNLEGCTNFDELPEEMQYMKSLVYLNMKGCIRLISLPNMNLISLKTLILSGCSNFKEFQVISQSLVVLHLDGTAIKGLPQDMQQLERLVLLNLRNCKMLECIPNGLGKLKVLEELILSGCSRLKNLLDVRHNMKHVQILLLDGIGVDEMPKISCFTGSEGQASVDVALQLSMSYPSEWPRGFDGVSSLRHLCLSGNDFVSLKNDIGQLYNLTWLDVKQCKKLKYVPMLPPRLEYFDAHGCDLLEKVATPLALLVAEHAHAIFNFSNCNNLDQEAQDSIISYTRRRSQLMLGAQSRYNRDVASGSLMRTCFPGLEVPKWFSYQSSGPVLESQLPPHWCDSRFTGIALCAVILSNGYQNQRNRLVVNCNCEFKSKDGSIHFTCIVGGWSELSNTPQKMESSHVFIGFTSMLNISKHGGYDEEGCFYTISSLEFQVTDGTEKVLGCEVLRCGFSFVYAADEREKICWDAKTVVIPERVENVPGGNSPMYEDTATTSSESKRLDLSENTIEEISSLHNIPSGSFNKEKVQGVKTFNTDILTEKHKDVFLDIACFFRSEDEYFIRSLLDSGDPDSPDAVSEVRDLAKEFLITISDGRVETNDELCKDLGSPRWLRLWKYKDIIDKLMKIKTLKEANDVRGIFLDMSEVMQSIAMERMTFINMRSLRYLKIYESCCPQKGESDCKLRFPDGLDFPLKEVRYFHWMKFPLNELPPDFRPENMVDLRLPYSKVERLWKGVKDIPRLKWLDLSHSSKLLNLSGLAKALSLQRLNLEGCTNLNELPREMKNMKSLVYLNMRGCVRLVSLPRMNLISLKTLILSDCSNLKEFQLISESLEVLHLDGTIIKGLPLAIQKIKRLVLLNLKNCKMLESLPSSLGKLKLLEELILSGCSRLKNLPDVRQSMKHVQTLLFDGTGVDEMPDIACFIGSQGQASVEMSFQHFGSYRSPSVWPRSVKGASSLRRLCLSGHDFVSLHNDIGHLYNLTWLDIKQCTKLRSIPMLPPRLQYFTAHGCDSLERVANPLAIQMLTEQIHSSFIFSNCNKLDQDATEAIISYTKWKSQMIVDALSRYNEGFTLEASIETCFPGWEVPTWFSHRASGSVLEPKLPPHWCANRFTGISLCAVILFPSHQNQRNRLLVKCNCVFKSEDGSLIRFSCTVGGCSEPGSMIESPHVFLSYASILDVRELRKDNEEECIHTQASFEFQVTDGTKELEGYEVIKSGISLVYASDDLQVNSSEHGTTVEKKQDIASSSWVQDLFGYIFLAFSYLIVFAVLSLSVLVFAPKYYLSFSDFCWPLLARILFYVAFGLFLKQDATREIPSQDR